MFDDPETGKLVTAPEYLSGNVRTKLDAARAAAAEDERLSVNVTALEEVQPPRVGMEDVEARIGAVWISPEEHQRFVQDILADPNASVTSVGSGIWRVKANRGTVRSTNEWGTSRRPAPDLLQSILEQKSIQVEDKNEDGKPVANLEETEAAQEKAEALQERFAEWVWEDPERASRLIDEYNRRFNSLALRDYTNEGGRLTLPGLAKTFTPHPHQRTAVARIISEPAVGPLPRSRGRQDRRNGDGRDGAQTPGHGLQAHGRGPEPHAGAVHPRVAGTVPAGPPALGRRPMTSRPRAETWPRAGSSSPAPRRTTGTASS